MSIRSPDAFIANYRVKIVHLPADSVATAWRIALPLGPEMGIAKSASPDEPQYEI